jgi:DNA-binding MarR family transcriptional regulator
VTRTTSTIDRRSVQVTITPAGQKLVDRATAEFEGEIGILVASLSAAQRARLSETASIIVVADAARRGIDTRT